ncbi:MAG TPA: hypothetical protein VN428_19125 [Bryobacteraceae bacterium]|nr:hypothetical protein [Bryobacteraceae bacterium]
MAGTCIAALFPVLFTAALNLPPRLPRLPSIILPIRTPVLVITGGFEPDEGPDEHILDAGVDEHRAGKGRAVYCGSFFKLEAARRLIRRCPPCTR